MEKERMGEVHERRGSVGEEEGERIHLPLLFVLAQILELVPGFMSHDNFLHQMMFSLIHHMVAEPCLLPLLAGCGLQLTTLHPTQA